MKMVKKKLLAKIYRGAIKRFSKGYGLGKHRPIKKLMKNVQSHLKSDFAIVQGSKMFLDPDDRLELSINGVYGEYETQIMKNHIKKGDVVIDVGANIGYFTLLYSRLVGEKGKVIAFEPEPKNFELLKKNIEINNYDNVIIEQKAVSDSNGTLNLFLADNMANHKIYQLSESYDKSIPIESVILDDYLKEHNLTDKINFIKIDVEGAEYNVFNGMKSVIAQSKNLKIFTEFMYRLIKISGSEPKDIVKILQDCGFTINFVDSEKNRILPADIDKLITSVYRKGTVNLFCERST